MLKLLSSVKPWELAAMQIDELIERYIYITRPQFLTLHFFIVIGYGQGWWYPTYRG